jgi:putative superfamily III holin-X
MTSGDVPPRRESAFSLVRRLVSGTVDLARLEVLRGRQEITKNVVDYRNGVVLLAIGFGFVILAVIVLVILFVVGLAALTGVPAWVIALVLLVVLLAVAGLLAWRGITKIGDSNFTPDETIAAVKEDIEWAKKTLLRRG